MRGQQRVPDLLQTHSFESLQQNQYLRDAMHEDRAHQFIGRLKWEVSHDDAGREVDQYDRPGAYYLIWVGPKGEHFGSLRLTPSNRFCMLADCFADHFEGAINPKADVWEVTRFCISPNAPKSIHGTVSSSLVKSACLFGLDNNVSQYLGLCFPSMLRVYRRIGWAPDETLHSLLDSKLLMVRWQVDFPTFMRLFASSVESVPADVEANRRPMIVEQVVN